ncbi:hypothetical protein BG004_003261 [Podila humilis]|nr:hypothetical protein BG004_003261 [Podila humilis]
MQDENIIEAQHGPKLLLSPTIVKNRPEEADVEGAPPRKSQKLTHPTPTDAEPASIQTRLNFTVVSKDAHLEQSKESNDVLDTLENLENTLAGYKQMIKDLQNELERESFRLIEQRKARNGQEEALMTELNNAEEELSILRRQEASQVEQMSDLDEQLLKLGLENENMDMELMEMEKAVQDFEDKTLKELSRSELEILTEEIMIIRDEYDAVMKAMEEQYLSGEELELQIDPFAGESYINDIRTLESDICHLEQAIREEGNEPEIPPGLSIDEEFAILAARFKLPRRSEIEKKLQEIQRKTKEEYYRQLNTIKFQHTTRMEQISGKTRYHESQLSDWRSKIARADETITRSTQELEKIRKDREDIRVQCELLLAKK